MRPAKFGFRDFFTTEVHEVFHRVKKRHLLSAPPWQRFTTKDNSAAIASFTSVKPSSKLCGKVDGYGENTGNGGINFQL